MDKNKKQIILQEDEDILYNDSDNKYNINEDEEDKCSENIEYFENTLNIIHKELIYYIENECLTIGEYLNKED